MKKQFLAWLLAALLAPLAGLAQTQYVPIDTLKDEAQIHWTQTFETKWRTVAIDAPIILPDVDAVPIVQLGYDMRAPLLTAEQTGWDEVKGSEETEGSLLLYRYEAREVPRSVNGRRVNQMQEQKGDWYGGFAPENTYVPMSDITFGEICDQINAELTRFGYDPSAFMVAEPLRLWSQHWYYYGYKEDALPGTILLEACSTVMGLPILDHIWDAVNDHTNGESRCDECWALFRLSAGYDAYEGRMGHLFVDAPKVTKVLADDVPLCALDTVKAAIEPEITAGHIRKIYELKFGYVLYNEPGLYREPNTAMPLDEQLYYAKPVWQVNCLYVKSPAGSLRKLPDDVYDDRNTLDYYQLLVDAQTGELIQESNAQDRCEYKGYLSWIDAGGRE